MSERENYLKVAEEVAEYVSRRGRNAGVEKVGITGSLAEGKKTPNDIDLLIIASDESALRYREMLLWVSIEDLKQRTLECLGFSQEEIGSFMEQFGGYPLDILILSTNPSDKLIGLSVDGLDPSFLHNILEQALVFNERTGTFEKQEIYPDDVLERINITAFEALKRRIGDELFLEKIKRRREKRKIIPLIRSWEI